MKVLVLPFDGSAEERELSDGEAKLEAMQAIVQGYVEAIDLPDVSATLWINEEGAYSCFDVDEETGKRTPQLNIAATHLARRFAPSTLLSGGVILGNAFVTGEADSRGETLPVPETLLWQFV